MTRPIVVQESWPGILTRSEKDGIRMKNSFQGQGGDMQTTQANMSPTAAIVIGKLVGAVSGSDVNLNDYQIGVVVEIKFFDVLVLDSNLIGFV
jgi:hypothetical protein